jgi:hypothetical protein
MKFSATPSRTLSKYRKHPLTEEEFEKQITVMSKILIEGQSGCKILFHHSFAEWLLDVKHCTQKYLCTASEGHAMLAMKATINAEKLTPTEVQEMALHMLRGNFQDSLQYNNFVHKYSLTQPKI